MKMASDIRTLTALRVAQRGVFSKFDLQVLLAEPHPAAFVRRVGTLIEHDILRRFSRGWYVMEGFDLATLSQRIAPESYVSFETVLARHLIIGTNPERRVLAVKVGRTREYSNDGQSIEHVGISPQLFFGFETVDGVRFADAEKAAVDVLYFHLRGRRFAFDIYSDMNVDRLDKGQLAEYIERYRNPRFISFAKQALELR